jgi:phosphoribosylaminoimidazole (AIR) synthetase
MPGKFNEETLQQIQMRAVLAGEDELYAAIAAAMPKAVQDQVVTAASLKFPSPADIGRAFRKSVLPAVKDGICGKAKYCRNRGTYDTIAKVSALVAEHVADAIAASQGIPPGTTGKTAGLVVEVSASILKEGLNRLCGCPAT